MKGKERHTTGYIVLSPFLIKAFGKIMISVLIADDHARIRDALQRLLERAGDMKVVAMAFNGLEAVKQAVLHCPNVAVMDVSMPFMDGVEATTQISADCPKTRVLMVSAHHAPNHIQRCIQAGALGYVLKDTVGDELAIAVRSLSQGHRYFSTPIAEVAKQYFE
jgi:two-component system invasion response regulator UvrY